MVLVPAVLGVMVILIPFRNIRRAMLIAGSVLHIVMVAYETSDKTSSTYGYWIGLDSPGLLFLCVTSILFAAVAVYTVWYLKRESDLIVNDAKEGFSFSNRSEAIFIGCLLFFLASMSLVCISRDMGLLWVAVETTTLVSAPLINFHQHHRSLEATWKYLLICSVGIAIALLGNFFLAYAGHGKVHLNIDDLISEAAILDPLWLKAAFLMLLVGYGTKMGLAPMHTWLPDAHSEAPSMVSALLSGALLNCAFLGILRANSILNAAALGSFSGELLIVFGLLSIFLAALFIVRQTDYKRMLAYSSIEHMGILSLGMGIGGIAGTGAMLHSVCHSFTKGMLFLCAGQLLHVFRSKTASEVKNMLKRIPVTGFLWIAGMLSITGFPPFGTFISEFSILKGAAENSRWYVAAAYLAALAIIFIAMWRIIIPMIFGHPECSEGDREMASVKEDLWYIIPASFLIIIVLVLGLYVPEGLWDFLAKAALTGGA